MPISRFGSRGPALSEGTAVASSRIVCLILAGLLAFLATALAPTSSLEPFPSPEFISSSARPQAVRGSYSPTSGTIELVNQSLRLALTYSPTGVAQLTVRGAEAGAPLIDRASTSLILENGSYLDLSHSARPREQVTFLAVNEAGLGEGVRVHAAIWIEPLALEARIEVALFENGPYFTYRLILPEGNNPIAGFAYLDGTVSLGGGRAQITYLADDDAIEEGTVPAAGLRLPVGQGKPLLLRQSDGSRGLLMALLDPSDYPSDFRASALSRGIDFSWETTLPLSSEIDLQPELPRLFVRLVDTSDLSSAFQPYRSLMHTLYPPAPVPSWFRHQWISWYLYGMDIDEQKLRTQIDYIASNLNDVGPWSILIDAGWYVAEGRPEGDWRLVDGKKFPSGLRSLVDYAHQKGIKVVLYFSASYLDDRTEPGNWLGLRGITDLHPEWLVPIQSGDPWRAFHYDYSNPGFQAYLREVLQDYLEKYGVDGIKVDGLYDTHLAVERGMQRGLYSTAVPPVVPITSVYAFIFQEAAALRPDVYLEAGWQVPGYSTPYFTLARQSDDTPDFDSEHPAPGLQEHVDYGIAQQLLLGQRPHLGNFWGDPNTNEIGLQWLDAGMALDAPVVLGFDLTSMTPEALSEYRSRLAQLRPFAGDPHLPSALRPDSFSSTSGGNTFLVLFNRGDQPKEMKAAVADHGLPGNAQLAGYDVTAGKPLSASGVLSVRVEPRSLRLFVLRTESGVLWTNSSFQVARFPERLRLEMRGPGDLKGYAYVATPEPITLLLNGEPVAGEDWSYDPTAGVLRIEYQHEVGAPTSLEIVY